MRVTFDAKEILECRKTVSFLPAQGTLSSRAVWLEADLEGLRVLTITGRFEYALRCKAIVPEPGLVGVEARRFFHLLETLTGNVEISCKENGAVLTLKHSSGVCKLPICDTRNYDPPAMPPVDACVVSESWDKDWLTPILDRVQYAIAEDTEANILTALCIAKEDANLVFRGLNGHLFAQIEICDTNIDPRFEKALISKIYLAMLRKFLRTEVSVLASDSRIWFQSTSETYSFPLAIGEFPNCALFLVKVDEAYRPLTVNRDDLVELLKRVSVVDVDNEGIVALEIADEGQSLRCVVETDAGEIIESVPVIYEGDVREIHFRTRDLLNVLQHLSPGKVTMQITTATGPCGFINEEDPSYRIVLMPLAGLTTEYKEE